MMKCKQIHDVVLKRNRSECGPLTRMCGPQCKYRVLALFTSDLHPLLTLHIYLRTSYLEQRQFTDKGNALHVWWIAAYRRQEVVLTFGCYMGLTTPRCKETRRLCNVKHGEGRNALKVLVKNPKGKSPLGRRKRRWVDNVTKDLTGIGCGLVSTGLG